MIQNTNVNVFNVNMMNEGTIQKWNVIDLLLPCYKLKQFFGC